MKKLIAACLLFTACAAPAGTMAWEKSNFHEVKVEEGEEEISYYFEYPSNGILQTFSDHGVVEMEQGGCKKFEFGEYASVVDAFYDVVKGTGSSDDDLNIDEMEKNQFVYKRLFYNGRLVLYLAHKKESDFGFWSYDLETGREECVEYVNKALQSLTDTPVYYNSKYDFRIDLLPEYKTEKLVEEEGVLLKKWVETQIEKT